MNDRRTIAIQALYHRLYTYDPEGANTMTPERGMEHLTRLVKDLRDEGVEELVNTVDREEFMKKLELLAFRSFAERAMARDRAWELVLNWILPLAILAMIMLPMFYFIIEGILQALLP